MVSLGHKPSLCKADTNLFTVSIPNCATALYGQDPTNAKYIKLLQSHRHLVDKPHFYLQLSYDKFNLTHCLLVVLAT